MLRGFLSAVILIISIVIIELAASGKLGLQHAPAGILIGGILCSLLLYFFLLLSLKFAIKNEDEDNDTFLSFMVFLSLLSLICLMIYLSAKYVEFAIIFAIFVALDIITSLTVGDILRCKDKN